MIKVGGKRKRIFVSKPFMCLEGPILFPSASRGKIEEIMYFFNNL
jgi:hypothetical protein